MNQSNHQKILRVGHSPDADDAFMFYALAKGKVRVNGYRVKHVIQDIQSLNKRALKGDLEVTAISAAVYPFVADKYWILSSGASVGRNYGPILVAKKLLSLKDLKRKRIAIPGKQTTAYLLLKTFLPDFVPVEMDFKAVIPAVKSGKVDAGLVIHEGQLNFRQFGLQKCADLGSLWHKKYRLPIPLGLDVVRKNLGLKKAKAIQHALYESIRHARQNEPDAIRYAAKFGRGTVGETLKQFVRMYVNEDTQSLKPESRRALKRLFENGVRRGLFKAVPKIEVIQ